MEPGITGTDGSKRHHERPHEERPKTFREYEAALERRLRRPGRAAAIAAAGGLGLIAANVFGVGEVAIAGAAAYVAYRRFFAGRTGEQGAKSKR
jgi:hypothetical protein